MLCSTTSRRKYIRATSSAGTEDTFAQTNKNHPTQGKRRNKGIFSRDEKKQDDMRHMLQNPKVKFYIGDVRRKSSVDVAMRGVDYVFAAAALKQVPSCEFFPMEATMTNVVGT